MKEIQYQSSCSERFMAGQLGRETAVRVPMLRCWWKKGVATYSLGIAIVNHRKPTYCRCWSWSPPVSKKIILNFITIECLMWRLVSDLYHVVEQWWTHFSRHRFGHSGSTTATYGAHVMRRRHKDGRGSRHSKVTSWRTCAGAMYIGPWQEYKFGS